MPRKIRNLVRDLLDAGFVLLPGRGKGDHRRYEHPTVAGTQIGLDGTDGDDAKPYQEQQVAKAIRKVREAGK